VISSLVGAASSLSRSHPDSISPASPNANTAKTIINAFFFFIFLSFFIFWFILSDVQSLG